MSFDPLHLAAFVASDASTLWFYDTGDTRAQVLAPDYFAAAADRLQDGDVIICQTSDALSLLPVFAEARIGSGLVLDVFLKPLRLTARADQRFGLAQGLAGILRSLQVDDVPAGQRLDKPIAARVTVAGPITSVSIRLITAANATVETQVVPVVDGVATASFVAPEAGSYRLRAFLAEDAAITVRSAIFVVTEPFALLLESGKGSLLVQEGFELLT